MTTEQKAFLDKIEPLAQQEMSRGILASLTIAQAIIESNWGKSKLATEGHNYFGIKGQFNGQSVYTETKEWVGDQKLGHYITIRAGFRKYPSMEVGVKDHTDFLLRERYRPLWGVKDYRDACRIIRECGYATSPTYSETLIKTIESLSLDKYDREDNMKLTVENGVIKADSILGVPFEARIVAPNGLKNVRTGIPMIDVIGVTIHNTANPTASAEDHAKWIQNVENADQQYISVHFFVDENSIVQTVPVNETCFHAGDGSGDGNRKTISIEICEDGDHSKAEQNAQILTAALLKTYPGIKIYKHQDWSGKFCPRIILGRNGWEAFKVGIYDLLNIPSEQSIYLVRITASKLNIRKDPSVLSVIAGTVSKGSVYTIVETQGDWGRLKSGAGWISLKHVSRV